MDTLAVLPNNALQTTDMSTDEVGVRRMDKRQKHPRACEFCRRRKGASRSPPQYSPVLGWTCYMA